MTIINAIAAIAVLLAAIMALARAVLGPTTYDRILSTNMFTTMTVLLMAVYGFVDERPEFIDIALLYAVIGFIGVIAVMKFIRFGHLGRPTKEDDEGDL